MKMSLQLSTVLLLGLLLVGCKKGGQAKQEDEGPTRQDIRAGVGKMLPSVQRFDAAQDLRNIAQLYSAAALLGTAPKKVEDLPELPNQLAQAIRDGVYVVLWNAAPNAASSTVVAYEKDVPDKGGMVAKLGGQVERMTAQEFQTAPKASGR